MSKFRFAGDPNDNWSGPKEIVAYGLPFTRDDWTEVPPELVSKFAGNAHFEPEDGDTPPAVKRKGGWPLGKPRKPRKPREPQEKPAQEQAEKTEEGDDGEDE